MREDDWIGCEYVATADEDLEPSPMGHSDKEQVQGMVVSCNAEAEVVIRPTGLGGIGTAQRKQAVCRDHAKYLTGEAPKEWEQCGEKQAVRALRLEEREVEYTTNE